MLVVWKIQTTAWHTDSHICTASLVLCTIGYNENICCACRVLQGAHIAFMNLCWTTVGFGPGLNLCYEMHTVDLVDKNLGTL